jgi:hypothetical protein
MFKSYRIIGRFCLEIARFPAEETLRLYRSQSLTSSIPLGRMLPRRKIIASDILKAEFSTVEDLIEVPFRDGLVDLAVVLLPDRQPWSRRCHR